MKFLIFVDVTIHCGVRLVTVLERDEVALHYNCWRDILCRCSIAKDMSSFKVSLSH